MAEEHTCCRLCKDNTFTRTIKVTRESEGNHYLVEVVNTSLGGQVGRGGIPSVIPDFSWKHFASLPDAETSVNAQYEASLKEGFRPLPPEPM
jgi:hypothetical protein